MTWGSAVSNPISKGGKWTSGTVSDRQPLLVSPFPIKISTVQTAAYGTVDTDELPVFTADSHPELVALIQAALADVATGRTTPMCDSP